jgi:hypothetical protein
MRSIVGVYDTHEAAVHAIESLKEEGYPIKQLSLMGNGTLGDHDLHQIDKHEAMANAPLVAGVVAGPILGALAGVGLFAIPGFGVVFGAGAIVGALAGLDAGLIGGGIVTVLTRLGMKAEKAELYEAHLKNGKYLIMMEGTEEEVFKAQATLKAHDTHHALEVH